MGTKKSKIILIMRAAYSDQASQKGCLSLKEEESKMLKYCNLYTGKR